jgi:hypothetical protein
MLSAWIAENGLHCTLNIGMWEAEGRDEARAWGVLLADVVRHIASALRAERGTASDMIADSVVEALLEELGSPTSAAEGGFSPGHS